jgi:cytochrome P450
MATNWQYCWQIASDSQNFVGGTDPALEHVFGQPCILTIDGEVHDDLRAMIDPNLRPRAVNRYIEGLARPIARRYLDEIKDRGSAALMAEYLEPVSVRALADMLGLKDVDSNTLRRWFHDLSSGFVKRSLRPTTWIGHPNRTWRLVRASTSALASPSGPPSPA